MNMKKKLLEFLKNLPLMDLGTGSKRHITKSKQIALKYAKEFYKPQAKVLDLGCGDGFWSEKLKQIGYQVVSSDAEKKYPDCRIIDANLPLPFPDNVFNLIWSLDVIEHLASPQNIIQEIKRVLKPEGAFILTTPNSYFWLYSISKIFGLSPKDMQRKDHQHFFHYNDIKKLFPDSRIYGYFCYTAPLKFKIKNSWLVSKLSPTFVIVSMTSLK